MAENEKKPKKPHSVRGYHRVLRQKSYTDKDGNFHTKPSWEYEKRSGYGSAFLSTFTLFLAIVVVFNIVMGTGYKGYKQAVRALYVTTETIGNVVQRTAEGVGFAFELVKNPLEALVPWEEVGKVEVELDGNKVAVDVLSNPTIYEDKSSKTVIIAAKFYREDFLFWFIPYRNLELVVIWSNHPDFKYGDVCYDGWWFGHWIINERNRVEWKGMDVSTLNSNDYPYVETWLKEKGYIQ